MSNYRLTVQYDGSRYDGWQRMGKDESDNTVSVRISEVIRKMTGSEPEINCGCRTEKGVHAHGQVINVKTDAAPTEIELKNYLNRYLPRDIAVISCDKCGDRFHASLNAKSVTYVYRLDVGNVADVFERRYAYHTFNMPDIEAMRQAAEYFVGSHDFKRFTTAKKSKSTIRNVSDVSVDVSGNIATISITADSFLHNMARLMIGMLLDVGAGLKKPQSVKNALEQDDEVMSFPAEPCGLFLERVDY